MPHRVSKAEFASLVEKAIAELPPPFDQYMDEIVIEIRDRPTADQLDGTETDPDDLLLGLYHGRPRTERSVSDDLVLPDVIYIFQKNIEEAVDSEVELIDEVRTTVLHEIGHHFGMSEDDLDSLGYG